MEWNREGFSTWCFVHKRLADSIAPFDRLRALFTPIRKDTVEVTAQAARRAELVEARDTA
jgi:hypothetical protein